MFKFLNYIILGTSGYGIKDSTNMINGSFVNKAITIVNTAIKSATPTLFLEISSYSSKFRVNLENKLYAA